MKTANSIVRRNEGKKTFSAVIKSSAMQSFIRTALGDRNAAARFTSTMLSVVSASEELKQCEPGTVIAAALRGEGMNLLYGQGYYVVPYKQSAAFILGYKGAIQLCLATGLYADIDCVDVREGERKGRDRRTGRPVIDFSVYEEDEERNRHPVVGYKAYFELKDGYYREEYWTVDEILRHAGRYSQAFSYELYKKWETGEPLTQEEQRKISGAKSPWYDAGGKQGAMMKKTVLRSLLLSGYAPMSNEVRSAIRADGESGEGYIPDAAALGLEADPGTGEVVEAAATVVGDAPAEAKPEAAEADAEQAEVEQMLFG